MLHLTANLNLPSTRRTPGSRLADLGISRKQKTGKLSGGQRAQLALTLALARHPRLLVLDEPTAPLDPVARHDFMATVMTAMADDGVSVVLSSHMLAELERVTDYLVLISNGRVRIHDTVENLLAAHRLVSAADAERFNAIGGEVIDSTAAGHADPSARSRRRRPKRPLPAGCESRPVGLEELALAYLRESITEPRSRWSERTDDRHCRRADRRAAAGPVDAPRLGRLASLPHDPHRDRRRLGPARPLPIYQWRADPIGLRRRDRLPADRFSQLPIPVPAISRQLRPGRPDQRPARVPARCHRRVRGCARPRPGIRNRHLPLRVDPRRRTDALGDRRAGTRRGRRCGDDGDVRSARQLV